MKRNAGKLFVCIYVPLLVLFTLYAALDTFVIPRRMAAAERTQAVVTAAETGADAEAADAEDAKAAVAQDADADTAKQPRITKTVHGQDSTQHTSSSAKASREADVQETTNAADSDARQGDTALQEENDAAASDDSTTARASALQIAGTVIGTCDDGSTRITITQIREYDTDIYIADVILSDAGALQTAFAYDTYGRNVKDETSAIADDNDALLAINGDFYGSRTEGYVIRNGVLYRDTAGRGREGLAVLADGSFLFYEEAQTGADALMQQGAVQAFSFGPALLSGGSVMVSETEEVGRAMASNPRTAIGIAGDLHYVFVVSDGRTDASEGLSLYELAQVMQSVGVTDAYNLDGGGSSTMVFQGTVVNNPTTGGRRESERAVSDIIYIGA